MKKMVAVTALFLAVTLTGASASVITSIPGGTVVPFPAVPCTSPNYACFNAGPVTFGPGITYSSTNSTNGAGSVFGYSYDLGAYGYGNNGSWTYGLPPMVGLNDSTDFWGSTDTITFKFSTRVSSVGGFLNYYPGDSTPTTIAVWDSKGNLIEATNLNFLTDGSDNSGVFLGFQESKATIQYFTLTDNYIGITNLTYAIVPEPSSMLLLGSGLLGAVAYGRRRMGL